MNPEQVEITSQVQRLMISHATTHATSPVHGVLIGKASGKTLHVTDAYPICHETPTKVLLETSLALVQSALEENFNKDGVIIGWYTAPELLHETKPSPVALRIAAQLEDHNNLLPVLVVLNNKAIVEGGKDAVVSSFGKEFGGQWMEPLKCASAKESSTSKTTTVNDLVDHWDKGVATPWTTAANVK